MVIETFLLIVWEPVSTSVLSDNDPSPAEIITFNNSLNTIAQTCQDVMIEHRYPHEAIQVVTINGYILLLERIPRHNAQKVVYLQYGILDSSIGSNWVGVLGLSHYNMNDMPGVAFRVALHLAKIKHVKKFLMFNYGSAAANMEVYGSPKPLDLGEY
ncbi:unnamed protein product [Fraxinus pennsylvanica]|uniref:Partial AB-hydrolase lipase domain-containing protein n=1 Tax=Fraxinus pennsylvanica TaxID=56036 RepID=A0AAD2DJ04_9LAMI|nr:unnamed protein product [Fraxinus pennsylvanica]